MKTRIGTVNIRRDKGLHVKRGAEAIDGKTYVFEFLWAIEDDDKRYPGEEAWAIKVGLPYPADAPSWIASGDIEWADKAK